MPQTYYTKEEYDIALKSVNGNAMVLAQKLCEAKGFPCIRGPENSPFGGDGEYCCDCPAEKECPFEWKQWSK